MKIRPEVVDVKGQPLSNVDWEAVFQYDADAMLSKLLAVIDDSTQSADTRAQAQAELEYMHARIAAILQDNSPSEIPLWLRRDAELLWIDYEADVRQRAARPSTTVTYVEPSKTAAKVVVQPEPIDDDCPTFE